MSGRDILGALLDDSDVLESLLAGDDDDISGDELDDAIGLEASIGIDEIIGALKAKKARPNAAKQRLTQAAQAMRLARAFDPNAVAVRRQTDNVRRRLIVPIPRTNVLASQSTTVTIAPQRLFRCERIMFDPVDTTDNFSINDIKVGQASQLASAGPLPASVFSPTSVSAYVHLDTADIGNTISFQVTNLDAGAPHVFSGVLLGTATVR